MNANQSIETQFHNFWAGCSLTLGLVSTPALWVSGLNGVVLSWYEPLGLVVPLSAIWLGLLGLRDASMTNGVGRWRAVIGITFATLSIALYESVVWMISGIDFVP